MLLYFLIASVGARNPLAALVTSATMMAASWLGMVCGALLMGACRGLAGGDPALMLVAAALVAFAFVAYHLVALARFSFDAAVAEVVPLIEGGPAGEGPAATEDVPRWARVGEPPPAEAGARLGFAAAGTADSGEARLEEACAAVADEHGLTARELDVLRLLARGRTSPVIQERLVVSHNTVKSHVRHIYAKVGVHSQQQLIDVVEARRGQLAPEPPR